MNGDGLPPIVGVSAAIQKAVALVEHFAPTGFAILIVGATGTGKELLARHIHHRSRRRGELVDVNCGALPREMAESLLFGHRRGAFTGAVESTVGHVERADGGTLFLDEVLHLPPEGQVKLLRVLETGDVQRLGEGRKRNVDLRIVAAAQDDTTERLGLGVFRRDLYQRLAGVVIHLPPLAERPEDIVPLAAHFAARRSRRPFSSLHSGIMCFRLPDVEAQTAGVVSCRLREQLPDMLFVYPHRPPILLIHPPDPLRQREPDLTPPHLLIPAHRFDQLVHTRPVRSDDRQPVALE